MTMKILVTGAKGFVGRNLCQSLKNIRDGKDRRDRFLPLLPLTVFECDSSSSARELEAWTREADFVFNFAGVNRPQKPDDFKENYAFEGMLLDCLEKNGNNCPVMLSSSIQASLIDRYADSAYGKSKLAAERMLRDYSRRTGAEAYIYRFPNLYGKWCRPNYNSAVATFCNNIAKGLPIVVNDPDTVLQLLYIDDLVDAMLDLLLGDLHRCEYSGLEIVPEENGRFCYAGPVEEVALGEIVELLESFKAARKTLDVPFVGEGSFSKKLYSTYLSYLDVSDFAYPLKKHEDERGSFTEIIRTVDRGQISVNVSKPGITKGQHWHHSKWEKFCVVSGEALIQMRCVNSDDDIDSILEYKVSGDNPTVVEMVPGYTHNIINLSDTQDLVTVMWANESFDPDNPDTYYLEV